MFIILFGNCTCTNCVIILCYALIVCSTTKCYCILNTMRIISSLLFLLKNLYCFLEYSVYSCSHAMFVITELE